MVWCSQEGFLRFFPTWPLGEAASFRGLRASGAFLVNASIDTAGTVSGVSLRSEAGGRCEFLSPWAGAAAPKAVCGGAAVHVAAVAGEPAPRFAFSTEAGQACTLAA